MIETRRIGVWMLPLMLAWPELAHAATGGTCSDASDCAENETCQKESYVSGCAAGDTMCDDTVHEAETGHCVTAPVPCASDADCGEYMACQKTDSGSCWQSSDGSSGCDDPDPNAPSYCTVASVSCETDDDCPREFECVLSQACPDIACAEGTDCDIPQCEPTNGACQPKQIACDDDSACPSDWSCIESVITACSGGGGTATGGTTDPAEPPPMDGGTDMPEAADGTKNGEEPPSGPNDAPDVAPDDSCTTVTSTSYCRPDAWRDAYAWASDGDVAGGGTPESTAGSGGSTLNSGSGPVSGDDAPTDPKSTETDADGSDDGSNQGGCSMGGRPTSSLSWLWLALGAAPLLSRRRSAQSIRR